MSTINIKVRMEAVIFRDTVVHIELKETVDELKKHVGKYIEHKLLPTDVILLVYCGQIMEDCNSLDSYNIFDGATVYAFKKLKHELPPLKSLTDDDIYKLATAIRNLSTHQTFKNELMKLNNPEGLKNFILKYPNLSKDPVAITLLQHPELLVKLSDIEILKHITENHPAFSSTLLEVHSTLPYEGVQNRFRISSLRRSALLNSSDTEDMEDLDDSSSSEANRQPVPRNSFIGTITASQLASAILSLENRQSQPSTSGVSTSNPQLNLNNTPISSNTNLASQLQLMREMGLSNDVANLEALRRSSDLESAIELVLNGDLISDNINMF